MYTSFFGLNEKPFSITPDPRYLFMSERHGEALAHLVYGVTESGGFIQLTGEVGTGKTTLVRTLLLNRLPDNANVAVVLNPQLSALEFLATICEELGVDAPGEPYSSKALIDRLNRHLLEAHAEGRRTILIVDEAQNLARDVLEQVRLLTNLETSKQKLLQIILIGQPELRELLARNDLRQLAQRITGRYHLEPLTREETAAYIEHRLKVAGALGEVFDGAAKRAVYRYSEGVPRLINVICDRALLGAYASESRRVSRRLVRRAANEISGKSEQPSLQRWFLPAASITALVIVGVGAAQLLGSRVPDVATTAAAIQSTTAPPAAPEPSAPEPDVVEDAAVSAKPMAKEPIAKEPLIQESTTKQPEADVVEETLDAQLRLARDVTFSEAAFATLFGIWGETFDAGGGESCDQAEQKGLSCHEQRGSWSSLRQLDRPAILTLTDTRGDSHEVVLSALQGEVAELSIAGVTVTHSVTEVSELWFGQFLVLWKPETAAALAPGIRNGAVVWLRRSLADIDERYRAEPLDSDVYDRVLAERVRDFQRDQRIDVDGFAGKQTQILINSMLGVGDRPRLTTPRLARD